MKFESRMANSTRNPRVNPTKSYEENFQVLPIQPSGLQHPNFKNFKHLVAELLYLAAERLNLVLVQVVLRAVKEERVECFLTQTVFYDLMFDLSI
jgi:hypothetical protein